MWYVDFLSNTYLQSCDVMFNVAGVEFLHNWNVICAALEDWIFIPRESYLYH